MTLCIIIINKYYINSKHPDLWNISNIVPIPKSGDLTKADNYRRISLTSVIANTYNRMILNRMRPLLYPILIPYQNGFRQTRSTVGQIIIRRILEGITNKNVLTFIDFDLILYIDSRCLK